MKVTEIEGIGKGCANKLLAAGIRTTDGLLKRGRTPKDRKTIAAICGVSQERLIGWINRADLRRIKGVGKEYSDLLEGTGIDTIAKLARRNPENLHAEMVQTNHKKNHTRATPALTQVRGWVQQAKKLPRIITY